MPAAECRLVNRAVRVRTSEGHRRVIRTRLRARVAHAVRKAARAMASDAIGVKTIIRGTSYTRPVTINVDVT